MPVENTVVSPVSKAPVEEPRRSAREVAERALALLAVYGYAWEPKEAAIWTKAHGIARYLSPKEQAFVGRNRLWHTSSLLGKRDKMAFSWRSEAVAALIWSLGGVDDMPPLDTQFELFKNKLVDQAMDDPERFAAEARLRPIAQLQAMEAFLSRQDRRARDHRHQLGPDKPEPGDPPLRDLDGDIVHERRYAMGWVMQASERWDELDDGPLNA